MTRGEIYYATLDPVIGREQAGRRPILIVSTDVINSAPLVVTVVPGTDGANIRVDRPHSVRVPTSESGLTMETVFQCFQIRALDKSRLSKTPAGALSDVWMTEIDKALAF